VSDITQRRDWPIAGYRRRRSAPEEKIGHFWVELVVGPHGRDRNDDAMRIALDRDRMPALPNRR
jgi:hypothetical protein